MESAELCKKPPFLVIADNAALYNMLFSRPYSFPKPPNIFGRQVLGDALEKGSCSSLGRMTSQTHTELPKALCLLNDSRIVDSGESW